MRQSGGGSFLPSLPATPTGPPPPVCTSTSSSPACAADQFSYACPAGANLWEVQNDKCTLAATDEGVATYCCTRAPPCLAEAQSQCGSPAVSYSCIDRERPMMAGSRHRATPGSPSTPKRMPHSDASYSDPAREDTSTAARRGIRASQVRLVSSRSPVPRWRPSSSAWGRPRRRPAASRRPSASGATESVGTAANPMREPPAATEIQGALRRPGPSSTDKERSAC